MKLLITAVLFLSSSLTMASGVWDVTNHTNEELKTEAEIAAALNTFPQILEKWDGEASEIKYLHLTIINFEWTGETLCSENDPRLKHETLTFIACPQTTIGMNCLFEVDPVLTPTGDPCKK